MSLTIPPLFSKTSVSRFKYCRYSFLFLGKPVVGGEKKLFTETITGFAQNIVLLSEQVNKWSSYNWRTKIKMVWAISFFQPCGNACCAALQRIIWWRHVIIVEFLSFFVNVGTRMSSEVPALFQVSFLGKLGNTAVENWAPPLCIVITSWNALITDFCYSAWGSQSPL